MKKELLSVDFMTIASSVDYDLPVSCFKAKGISWISKDREFRPPSYSAFNLPDGGLWQETRHPNASVKPVTDEGTVVMLPSKSIDTVTLPLH